jgi:hypothetical protein
MFVVMIAALILSRAASVLASENPIGIAPQQEITFTAPTIVGGNLLPARNCKVLHEMQGTTHIMIFKQRGGKTEAKAKGNLVPLDAKATRTRAALHEKRKNQRVLVEMTFRGDTTKHVPGPWLSDCSTLHQAALWPHFPLEARPLRSANSVLECETQLSLPVWEL